MGKAGLDGNIDVIVPRGGKALVARRNEARVPVFAHLEGIVTSISTGAPTSMAVDIIANAKVRRPASAGRRTLLVDRA